MNSEFKGMVRVASQKLDAAIANFDAYEKAATAAKDLATFKAMEDKVKVRTWLFFKKEISVWDNMAWNHYVNYTLARTYPDIFSHEQAQFCIYSTKDMDDIKALYSINPKEVTLSAGQAKLVTYWGEKNVPMQSM